MAAPRAPWGGRDPLRCPCLFRYQSRRPCRPCRWHGTSRWDRLSSAGRAGRHRCRLTWALRAPAAGSSVRWQAVVARGVCGGPWSVGQVVGQAGPVGEVWAGLQRPVVEPRPSPGRRAVGQAAASRPCRRARPARTRAPGTTRGAIALSLESASWGTSERPAVLKPPAPFGALGQRVAPFRAIRRALRVAARCLSGSDEPLTNGGPRLAQRGRQPWV